MKTTNHFTISNYEVHFLQDKPVTVCVVRSLKNRKWKHAGIVVCHKEDKWDEATGRHKALKKTLDEIFRGKMVLHGTRIITMLSIVDGMPTEKEIQRAYWEHYKEAEDDRSN